MDLGLTGRAGVVTGASHGIGRAAARLMAAEGARLLLVGRGGDALREAVKECRDAGGEAERLEIDVTSEGAAQKIVGAAEEAFGPVELLVNSAGTNWARPLAELTEADFERHWRVRLLAPFALFQEAIPKMAQRGYGRVVSILPGPIDTEMWAGVLAQTATDKGLPLPEVIATAENSTQRGRFGTPEEAGAVIAFLCSVQAANVTGAAYTCDGGAVQALY